MHYLYKMYISLLSMLEYEIQIKAYIYLYVYIHTSYTTYLHIIIKKYIKTACLYSLQTSES